MKPYKRNLLRRMGLVLLVTSLMFVSAQAVWAQQGVVERYFDETKHSVRQPFLAYFDKFGGIATFGYPISREFTTPGGVTIQYFQRARLEYRPNNPERYKVEPGLIGDELGYSQSFVFPNLNTNRPNCEYFVQTGHYVCDAFLEFFKSNGHIEVFGYPISEYRVERDRIVQEFQRMRLEWHPEFGNGQKVQIAPLGLASFNERGFNPEFLKPAVLSPGVTRLFVNATVKDFVSTSSATSQTINVFVTDQVGGKLKGAEISGMAALPNGETVSFRFDTTTDENGIARYTLRLPLNRFRQGEWVNLELTVTYNNRALIQIARLSFLIW